MQPAEPPILRERIAAALAARTVPATVAELAATVLPSGMPSALRQTGRALVELERQGVAVRQSGDGARRGGGRVPDQWTATR